MPRFLVVKPRISEVYIAICHFLNHFKKHCYLRYSLNIINK